MKARIIAISAAALMGAFLLAASPCLLFILISYAFTSAYDDGIAAMMRRRWMKMNLKHATEYEKSRKK